MTIAVSPWRARTGKPIRVTETPKTVLEIKTWKLAEVELRELWVEASFPDAPDRTRLYLYFQAILTDRQTARDWCKIEWQKPLGRPVIAWTNGPEVLLDSHLPALADGELSSVRYRAECRWDGADVLRLPPMTRLAIVAKSIWPAWVEAGIHGQ